MYRYFILAILLYILYRLIKGAFKKDRDISRGRADGVIDEMVQDPYCRIYIPRRQAVRRDHEGNELFFCSEECADKFEAENKQ
jgi:YHS domain-containing protein